MSYKPPTKSDTSGRLTGRATRAWNKALKVAKEKGRGLKKSAERAARVTNRRFEKDKLAKDPAPQPSTPLPIHDEKKFLRKEREAFKLYDINLEVPRGQLCAIVGPIGAGKSSLVQGIIGGMALQLEIAELTHESTEEMRKTDGEVIFGGSVAYCAQTAWIRVCAFLHISVLSDSHESRRVILSAITFYLAPHSMRSAINPWFVIVPSS